MSRLNISKFLSVTAGLILLSSCANMQAMLEEQVQEEKEISVEQKLQVSIPIPDNSKYLVNKTVIFGEGNKFSGILYLQHDESADDIVNFYRKNMISDGWSEIGIVISESDFSNIVLITLIVANLCSFSKLTRINFDLTIPISDHPSEIIFFR